MRIVDLGEIFSTQQQDLSRQIDLLKQYNCNEILTEKFAGTKAERELVRLKDKLRRGDIVVSASARGRKGGRPKVNQKQIEKATKLYESEEYSVKEIEKMTGISRSTLYRYLEKAKVNS